jgi:hypothetical protein
MEIQLILANRKELLKYIPRVLPQSLSSKRILALPWFSLQSVVMRGTPIKLPHFDD